MEAQSPSPAPNLAHRELIAKDTLARTEKVILEHADMHATLSSTFVSEQLPALDQAKNPRLPPSAIDVVNSDSFTAARRLASSIPKSKGKIAVLNLASDVMPGGGWIYSLSKTQASPNRTSKLALDNPLGRKRLSATLQHCIKP